AGITDAERSRAVIGQRRADSRRRDNRQPEKEWMKFLGPDLHQYRNDKNDPEDSRSDKITCAFRLRGRFAKPRHRYRIAGGFTERCREDLNDPENKRDLRNFTNNVVNL